MFTLCNNLLFAFYNEIKDVICMYRYVLFMERMGGKQIWVKDV